MSVIKTPEPQEGEYEGIADFVHRNHYEEAFMANVSGDQTVEEYLYGGEVEDQDLIAGVVSDLNCHGSWAGRIRFKQEETDRLKGSKEFVYER